jgi:Ni/Co efflux regulator RcnB
MHKGLIMIATAATLGAGMIAAAPASAQYYGGHDRGWHHHDGHGGWDRRREWRHHRYERERHGEWRHHHGYRGYYGRHY